MSKVAMMLGFGPYMKTDTSEYWSEWHLLRMLRNDIVKLQEIKDKNKDILSQLQLKEHMFKEQLHYMYLYAPHKLCTEGIISEFTLTRLFLHQHECNSERANRFDRLVWEDANREYNELKVGRTPSMVIRSYWDDDIYLSFDQAKYWLETDSETLSNDTDFMKIVHSNPKEFVWQGFRIVNGYVSDMSWAYNSLTDTFHRAVKLKFDIWEEQREQIRNKNHIKMTPFLEALNISDELVLY